jgi:hypothetical protein
MHAEQSVCVKRGKKRLGYYWSSMDKRDERKRTLDDASRKRYFLSKPRHRAVFGISVATTCLLATWQALFRGHDFYSGLFVEHGKPLADVKRKTQAQTASRLLKQQEVADELVVAMKFL